MEPEDDYSHITAEIDKQILREVIILGIVMGIMDDSEYHDFGGIAFRVHEAWNNSKTLNGIDFSNAVYLSHEDCIMTTRKVMETMLEKRSIEMFAIHNSPFWEDEDIEVMDSDKWKEIEWSDSVHDDRIKLSDRLIRFKQTPGHIKTGYETGVL